jgi:hypothetical protein
VSQRVPGPKYARVVSLDLSHEPGVPIPLVDLDSSETVRIVSGEIDPILDARARIGIPSAPDKVRGLGIEAAEGIRKSHDRTAGYLLEDPAGNTEFLFEYGYRQQPKIPMIDGMRAYLHTFGGKGRDLIPAQSGWRTINAGRIDKEGCGDTACLKNGPSALEGAVIAIVEGDGS